MASSYQAVSNSQLQQELLRRNNRSHSFTFLHDNAHAESSDLMPLHVHELKADDMGGAYPLSVPIVTSLGARSMQRASEEDDEVDWASIANSKNPTPHEFGRTTTVSIPVIAPEGAVQFHVTTTDPSAIPLQIQRTLPQSDSASIVMSTAPSSTPHGCIYFVRHGESNANESNVYSGNVWDVELTPFGKMQARNGGKVVKSKGFRFDEVHVSNLLRAKQTMQLLLEEAGHPDIPVFEAPTLAERNFGVWTRRNKNLLQRSYGLANFDHLLQSPYAAPLHGESLAQMYHRTRNYLLNVLRPARDSGKHVLVVCHQYILEMVGLVLNNIPPENYFDFSMPNARPMTEDELRAYVKAESETRKHIADFVSNHFASIFNLSLLVGALLKVWLEWEPSHLLFQIFLAGTLGFQTFWSLLEMDLNIWRKDKAKARQMVSRSSIVWVARFVIAGAGYLAASAHGLTKLQQVTLLFIVPPALTCPTLSSLWGGDFSVALITTMLYSFVCPVAIIVLWLMDRYWVHRGSDDSAGISVDAISSFFAIVGLALVLPTALAQGWRTYSPVESKKVANKWKFLGIVSMALLAMGGSYYYCRKDFWQLIFNGDPVGVYSGNHLHDLLCNAFTVLVGFIVLKFTSSVIARQFGKVLHVFVLAQGVEEEKTLLNTIRKLVSIVADRVFTFCTSAVSIDIFVTMSTPNIFLVLTLLPAPVQAATVAGEAPSVDSSGFWLLIAFFIGTALDDARIVHANSQQCLLSDIQANTPQPIAQGWMERIPRKLNDPYREGNLRRRYFILTEHSLQYYLSPDVFYFQGSIQLDAQSEVVRAEELWQARINILSPNAQVDNSSVSPLLNRHVHYLHPTPGQGESIWHRRLFVLTASRSYELQLDTIAQREQWVALIRQALSRMQEVERLRQTEASSVRSTTFV